jgi:hypothetical protein
VFLEPEAEPAGGKAAIALGCFRATSAVSSSASAIVTRPIARVVTSARTRLPRSSARRKIVRGWSCEVDAAPLRGRTVVNESMSVGSSAADAPRGSRSRHRSGHRRRRLRRPRSRSVDRTLRCKCRDTNREPRGLRRITLLADRWAPSEDARLVTGTSRARKVSPGLAMEKRLAGPGARCRHGGSPE